MGLALTNSTLGVAAALTGGLMGALLQNPLVKGVPTVVFLDAQGKERTDLRIVDFMTPDQFLIHLARVRKPEP